MRSTLTWLLAALLLLTSARAAMAAGNGRGDDDDFFTDPHIEAQQFFVKARGLQKAAKHAEAAELLQRALKLHKRPDIAVALGESEAATNSFVAAAEHLTYALELLPPNGKEAKRATDAMRAVRKHVTSLRFRIVPPEARLYLDGKLLPDHSERFVLAGEHTLAAEHDGRHRVEEVMQFLPNRSEDVELVLPKLAQKPIDEGAKPWMWIAGIGGTLTIAAIVSGAVMTGIAGGHDNSANELLSGLGPLDTRGVCRGANTTVCEQLDEARASQDEAQNAANGLWVTAGIVGVGTVLGAVLSAQIDANDASSATRITPIVGPTSGGLQLTGRW